VVQAIRVDGQDVRLRVWDNVSHSTVSRVLRLSPGAQVTVHVRQDSGGSTDVVSGEDSYVTASRLG